ncbi:Uncharacterised protein [Vibrio cholerae]|nr:Uncharacterised protein [Vibrio cholerae]
MHRLMLAASTRARTLLGALASSSCITCVAST